MKTKTTLLIATFLVALGIIASVTDGYAQIRISRGSQVNFVDADGDGVCDLQGTQGQQGRSGNAVRVVRGKRWNQSATGTAATCPAGVGCGAGCGNQANFVDANGDGVCDNFIDEDGDGICDTRANRGQGRFVDADGDGVCDNFVDEDGDGINDRSPLAQLDLTDEQKAQIVEIRASGPGPHRDEIQAILTEEQLEELAAIRAERCASQIGAGQRGRGAGQGRGMSRGRGMGQGRGACQANSSISQ